MAKQRIHNEYFRTVCVRSVWGLKTREPELIDEILSRRDSISRGLTRESLEEPYRTIVGYESSRKSCPTCKAKLGEDEWVWSWCEYVNAKLRSIQRFCRECYPDVQQQLESHREECGCGFNLVGYQNQELPDWLTLKEEECNNV